jgi:hydroxymethylglutaryl-CoA reductase (NADPH)
VSIRKLGRTHPRSFYHAGRQPSVLFFQNQRTFAGVVSDVAAEGLGLVLEGDKAPELDSPIEILYIERPEEAFKIEGLRIATLRRDYSNGRVHIGIQVTTEPQVARLQQILVLVTEGQQAKTGREFSAKKLPSVRGRVHYSPEAINERLSWTQNTTGTELANLSLMKLDPYSLMGNIENLIGSVEMPVGVTSPILINGTYVQGHVPVPIATSEGALVSSISRGAYVISLAGGTTTRVFRQTMVRSPIFFCKSIGGAQNLERWITNHFDRLSQKVLSMSSIAKLQSLKTYIFSSSLHVQFYFSTGDAAGQNMTTVCTFACCELIQDLVQGDESIGLEFYTIEGNMSGDKKANIQNFIMGRGIGVMAEVFLSEKILRRVLRVDPDKILRVNASAEAGAQVIGMTNGFNINFANVIAGIFAATGQDLACIHESSAGIFKVRGESNGIVYTAYLPSVVIGTVGGGTMLPGQKDCLDILGCNGTGKAFRLAEIIAATCLALDISTSSAITTNEFVKAHEKLGRNRPDKFSRSQIDAKFFQKLLAEVNIRVINCEARQLSTNQGILTKLFAKSQSGISGIHRYSLRLRNDQKEIQDLNVVLKIKNGDADIIEFAVALVRLLGEENLANGLTEAASILGFRNNQSKEAKIYLARHPGLASFHPKTYGVLCDETKQLFAILMEDLSDLRYYSSVAKHIAWNETDKRFTLSQLADLQSKFWDVQDMDQLDIRRTPTDDLVRAKGALLELTEFNHGRRPDIIGSELFSKLTDFFKCFESNVASMTRYHQTLSHNDFNPRNLCMRNGEIVIYDWELAKIQNPQYDCVEFILYTMTDNLGHSTVELLEHYRNELQVCTGQVIERYEFLFITALNIQLFIVIRLNLYILATGLIEADFLPELGRNAARLLVWIDTIMRETQSKKNTGDAPMPVS